MSDLPKLVRDKISEIIEDAGENPEFYTVSDEEADKWVRRKILEEAKEFSKGRRVRRTCRSLRSNQEIHGD
jgi:predicted house-cleaning noncanonical NTP pyrophosphatase (MazG superfamily)